MAFGVAPTLPWREGWQVKSGSERGIPLLRPALAVGKDLGRAGSGLLLVQAPSGVRGGEAACPSFSRRHPEGSSAQPRCRRGAGPLEEGLEPGLQHPAPPPAAWPPGSLKGDDGRQASAEGTPVLGICSQQPQAGARWFPWEAEIVNLGNSSPGPHHSP